MSVTEKSPALRILCLHGYMQSAEILYERTAVLRGHLNKLAELVYIDAPLLASDAVPTAGGGKVSLAWWNSDKNGQVYAGFNETMTSLARTMEEKGPFHGVLGFSQGAALAAILASRMQRDSISPLQSTHPPLQFVIVCGGFISRCPQHQLFFEQGGKTPSTTNNDKIGVTSLHIWGENDTWVTPDRSEALCSMFERPEKFIHDGGHFIPTNANARQRLSQFIQQFHPQALL